MAISLLSYPTGCLSHLTPEAGLFREVTYRKWAEKFESMAMARSRRIETTISDAAAVTIFTEQAIAAGPGLLQQARIRAILGLFPLLGLKFLLAHPSTEDLLFGSVVADPDAAYGLLRAIDEGRVDLRHSRQELEATLLTQPIYGLLYAWGFREGNPTPAQADFLVRFRERVSLGFKQNPQATLVHLLLHPNERVPPHTELLNRCAISAYIASRLLISRGFTGSARKVGGITPKWATHLALWSGFDDRDDPDLEAAICQSPMWVGEYIASSPEERYRNWDWVNGLYTKAEAATTTDTSLEMAVSRWWMDLICAQMGRYCNVIMGKNPRFTFEDFLEKNY